MNEPALHTQKARGLDGGGVLATSYGLTKRELIAAMAMQGVLSGYWGNQSLAEVQPDYIANEAVNYADALLEALK